MVKDTTLYDRLNIKSDATDTEINTAFKKLARQYHPDKNTPETQEENTKKFQDIQQAKEVLLDQEKRNLYNQVGMDMFKNNMDQQPDMNSFFSQFQNQFNPFQNNTEQKEDIEKKINVTLEQIYNEETITINYKFKSSCVTCNGEGTSDGKSCTCTVCNGRGMQVRIVQMGPMIQQMQTPCGACKGKGKTVTDANKCSGCNSKTYVYKDKTIQVPLKAGLSSGNRIQLAGKGHQLKNMKTDLVLVINEMPHPLFKRVNNDLIISVELKLYQALFGFEKSIEHLDKQKIHFSSVARTDYNKVVKIQGKGMKSINGKSNGDLYIRFTVNIPNLNNMDNDTKQKCKTLLKAADSGEVNCETYILNNKTQYTKCNLVDCKERESLQIQNLLMQPVEQPDEAPPREQQCVHQ
jgi:DnaJ-class molecular chaperone